MKRLTSVVASLLLVLVIVQSAEAWPRIFRRRGWFRRPAVTVFRNRPSAWGTTPAEVAAAKAAWCANNNYRGHPGGGFGGARYEGFGWSTQSAAAALSYCCYTGQRPLAASAVYQASDGSFYAVKLFW